MPLKDRHIGSGSPLPIVVTEPLKHMISRGEFGVPIRKFGNNPDVGTSEEDLWDGGGTYGWPTAAEALEILSGNGADAAPDGTGARTVEVQGLDADWLLQTQTVSLDGATPVAITGTWRRVFRARVMTAGSGEKNAGAITVRVASAGATRALITTGRNQTLMALFTIPAGQVGFLQELYFGNASNKIIEVALYVRPLGEVFQIKRLFHNYREPFQYAYSIPLQLDAKSDIVMRSSAASSGDPVSAGFTLWYEPV